jgi:CO/xanthine dehydrogenase FAD-binding subunit
MVAIGDYVRAGSVAEILAVIDRSPIPARLIGGGTDLLAKLDRQSSDRVVVVDVSDVQELAGIGLADGGLRIGAATKLADIENCDLLRGAWCVLADAAVQIGSPQIRNLATLGGNICNASPAADTVPPLLVLDARAEVISSKGRRTLPLAEFFAGPGATVLNGSEVLAAIYLPEPPPGAAATYLKHSPRRAMDLAVVGVAALLAPANGRLEARIALGAVAPTPLRAREAEARLAHAAYIDDGVISDVARLAAREANPISDVRASAEYRSAMVETLTGRALRHLLARFQQ